MFITEENASAIGVLESRMLEFYRQSASYLPFAEESCQPELWEVVLSKARDICARGECRILEVGSGRSGFHRALTAAGLNGRAHYTAHDVTPANESFLREHADAVLIGDPLAIAEPFDIVFHSFVLEHVSRPKAFLQHLFATVRLGGFHIFSCPRYDVPGILPPSARHLSIRARAAFHLVTLQRLLFRRPQFPLLEDPAIFHIPYRRDRDAIHCVALSDILRLHTGVATVDRFKVPAYSLRDWAVKRLMALHLIIAKPA